MALHTSCSALVILQCILLLLATRKAVKCCSILRLSPFTVDAKIAWNPWNVDLEKRIINQPSFPEEVRNEE